MSTTIPVILSAPPPPPPPPPPDPTVSSCLLMAEQIVLIVSGDHIRKSRSSHQLTECLWRRREERMDGGLPRGSPGCFVVL